MRYLLGLFIAVSPCIFELHAEGNSGLNRIYLEAKALLDESKIDEARLMFSKLHLLDSKAKDSLDYWIIDHLSDTYYEEGNIDASIYWYLEELRAYSNCYGNRSAEVGKMHYWIGENFREKGDFVQAAEQFDSAIDIFKVDPPETEEYHAILTNCIDFFDDTKETEKALKLSKLSINSTYLSHPLTSHLNQKHNIALSMLDLNYDKGYEMLLECRNGYQTLGLIKEANQTSLNLASYLLERNQLVNIQKPRVIFDQTNIVLLSY